MRIKQNKLDDGTTVARWLRNNGFPAGSNYYLTGRDGKLLVGKVLGEVEIDTDEEYECCSFEDGFEVEFDEGTSRNFMRECVDKRDYDQKFPVSTWDEVAVFIDDYENAYVISRKLSDADKAVVKAKADEKRKRLKEQAEEEAAWKAERLIEAQEWLDTHAPDGLHRLTYRSEPNVSLPRWGLSGVEQKYSRIYTINNVEVPFQIGEQVIQLLAPQFKAIAEKAQAEQETLEEKKRWEVLGHCSREDLEKALAGVSK
jgi:hypothetical protein